VDGAAGPAHFIAIECSMQWLFKDILSGGQGSPPDFGACPGHDPGFTEMTNFAEFWLLTNSSLLVLAT
jgi:hypothetical protein